MALFRRDIDAFQGTIVDADYRNQKSDVYILHCHKIIVKNKQFTVDGFVALSQGSYKKKFIYGDVIRISGSPSLPVLPANPGEFNYRKYLQLNNKFFYFRLKKNSVVLKIFSKQGNWTQSHIFNPIRQKIRNLTRHYLSDRSATIVKALILGERGDLDKSIISDFQKVGVIHVLAISGLHVGFIALILLFMLSILQIPRKISMALVILFLVFFMALVDFKAPVVRASLMLGFYYLAKFIIRPQKPLNIIALSGIVILMIQPKQLLLPGFQYSFTAVFGLIYGSRRLNNWIPRIKSHRKFQRFFNKNIRMPFIGSLSAILATVPITWYYFGSFQTGAIVANIFIIPFIAVILFVSIIFICFSWIPYFPVKGLALLINFLIDTLIHSVNGFASLPYVQIVTGHPHVFNLILIIISIFLVFNVNHSKARSGLIGLAIIATLVYFGNSFISKYLKVTFINVGQGDAILIHFPNDKTTLIDAGNKGFGFDAGKQYVDPVLKYYGINHIDYLIGSHPHSDHIGGFEYILKNYEVDTLIFNRFHVNSDLYTNIVNLARRKKIFLEHLEAGDMINADQHTRLYVLHPTNRFEHGNEHSGDDINNSSLVIKLVYGKNSFLLDGDAENAAEHALLRYGTFLDCDLLKVGHHGSGTSSGNEFLNIANPEYAVISVGRKNKFKHPSPLTLVKFEKRHIPVYRTDICGAVIFESDGKSIKRINWR